MIPSGCGRDKRLVWVYFFCLSFKPRQFFYQYILISNAFWAIKFFSQLTSAYHFCVYVCVWYFSQVVRCLREACSPWGFRFGGTSGCGQIPLLFGQFFYRLHRFSLPSLRESLLSHFNFIIMDDGVLCPFDLTDKTQQAYLDMPKVMQFPYCLGTE